MRNPLDAPAARVRCWDPVKEPRRNRPEGRLARVGAGALGVLLALLGAAYLDLRSRVGDFRVERAARRGTL